MSLFDSQMQIPQAAIDAFQNVSAAVNSAGQKALTLFQPSQARLANAGLAAGGVAATSTSSTATAKFSNTVKDWRVKISLADSADYFYNAAAGQDQQIREILAPLSETDGVIFPYTPNISVTHAARYGSQQLTHSNYTNYAYEGSEVQAITIAGDFTAQTQAEALYVLACIQFFRAATKMWFGGNSGSHVGNPPPMVFLNGYGDQYFPNVPCVITSFTHTMPPDVDYIAAPLSIATNATMTYRQDVTLAAGTQFSQSVSQIKTAPVVKNLTTMIPTQSQITVTLQPIYSRKNIYDNFSLDKFAKGELLGSKVAGKGGFI
jgi:hypothetical protein